MIEHNNKARVGGGGPCMRQILDLGKKEPKNVLCGRLCIDKKQGEVRIVKACRNERGCVGHLSHVEWGFKTHRNLQTLESKA